MDQPSVKISYTKYVQRKVFRWRNSDCVWMFIINKVLILFHFLSLRFIRNRHWCISKFYFCLDLVWNSERLWKYLTYINKSIPLISLFLGIINRKNMYFRFWKHSSENHNYVIKSMISPLDPSAAFSCGRGYSRCGLRVQIWLWFIL